MRALKIILMWDSCYFDPFLKLQDRIVSLLKRSPADQYTLYRNVHNSSMSEMTKTIADLKNKKIIHVVSYRKSKRTGLDIPVYSLLPGRTDILDLHGLLGGVTSERLVEYDFVSRNLCLSLKKADILDIGAAGSGLVQAIREFRNSWRVIGIDMAEGTDARMDARSTGFRDCVFDHVNCISTIEHVGLSCNITDEKGDSKAMGEIFRILKKGGRAIVTVPYGKSYNLDHHVYNRRALAKLVILFSVEKSEFYRYKTGRWIRCSQVAADRANSRLSQQMHSAACACLLLKKR